VLYISPKTAADVLQQLQHMHPGKVVVYGRYVATLSGRSNYGNGASDERRIVELVQILDRAKQVMLFHKRVSLNEIVCIARGIEPSVRLRLEAALERFPIKKT
jgi:hypothetical protein